jgi:hypothetical protein
MPSPIETLTSIALDRPRETLVSRSRNIIDGYFAVHKSIHHGDAWP